MTARREFPVSVQKAALARANGRCEVEGCGALFQPDQRPELHHALEDFLGGEPTLENCVVACVPCHREITKARAPALAKTRRLEKAAAGIRPRKAIIPGSKASKMKKKLDGTVEWRR